MYYTIANTSETKYLKTVSKKSVGTCDELKQAKKYKTQEQAVKEAIKLLRKRNFFNGYKIVEIQESEPVKADIDNEQLEELLVMLEKVPDDIPKEKELLSNQLSQLDLLLTDINHQRLYGKKLSASMMCKRDLLVTKILKKRREVKDKYMLLELIESKMRGENIKSRYEGFKNRQYTPRILKDIDEQINFDEWWNNNNEK